MVRGQGLVVRIRFRLRFRQLVVTLLAVRVFQSLMFRVFICRLSGRYPAPFGASSGTCSSYLFVFVAKRFVFVFVLPLPVFDDAKLRRQFCISKKQVKKRLFLCKKVREKPRKTLIYKYFNIYRRVLRHWFENTEGSVTGVHLAR